MPRRVKDPNGANVDELLKEEAEHIQTLRQRLGEELLATDILTTVDDIYLLRFLLSAHTVDEAEKNVRDNISWRVKHYDTLLQFQKTKKGPLHDTMMRFQTVGFSGVSDKGNPIFVVRVAHSDLHGLMNTLTEEQVTLHIHHSSEVGYCQIDETTRKTRVLTKMVSIIDLEGFSITKNNESRFRRAIAASSHLNMTHYPQLLGKQAFVNLPRIFYALYKGFKLVMPKSATEKTGFCPYKNTTNGDASKCPFVQSIGAVNALPPFLGGKGECPEDLVAMEDREVNKAMTKINIRAGQSHTTSGIPVPVANAQIKAELLVVNHSVNIQAFVIPEGKTENEAVHVVSKSDAFKLASSDGLKILEWDIPVQGELIVKFLNDSRFRSKQVEFHFSIVEDSIADAVVAAEEEITKELETLKLVEDNGSVPNPLAAQIETTSEPDTSKETSPSAGDTSSSEEIKKEEVKDGIDSSQVVVEANIQPTEIVPGN